MLVPGIATCPQVFKVYPTSEAAAREHLSCSRDSGCSEAASELARGSLLGFEAPPAALDDSAAALPPQNAPRQRPPHQERLRLPLQSPVP